MVFGNLINASIRLAVKDRNPKLLGLLLKLVLLLAYDTKIDKSAKECRLLQCGIDAFGNENKSQSEDSIEGRGPGGPGIQSVLSYISSLLPNMLPTKSGFSQQAIEFLRSKNLFVPYDSEKGDFELTHIDRNSLKLDKQFLLTKDTTTISADSVVCAVSNSEKMANSFDHVWVPLSAVRLIYLPLVAIWNYSEGRTCAWLYCIPVILAAILGFAFALLGLALYPLLLIYFYFMHGFKTYTEPGGKHNAQNEPAGEEGGKYVQYITV